MPTPIATIKTLNVGTKGLEAAGLVKYENEPRHITGEQDGKPYDFWSQFIVIEDSTDSIGANVRISQSDKRIEKGQNVIIEKAALDSYVKDGETKLSLKGSIKTTTPSQPQQATSQAAGRPKANDDNAEGKVRHGIVCAYIQGGRDPELETVKYWTFFVMHGYEQPPDIPSEDIPY